MGNDSGTQKVLRTAVMSAGNMLLSSGAAEVKKVLPENAVRSLQASRSLLSQSGVLRMGQNGVLQRMDPVGATISKQNNMPVFSFDASPEKIDEINRSGKLINLETQTDMGLSSQVPPASIPTEAAQTENSVAAEAENSAGSSGVPPSTGNSATSAPAANNTAAASASSTSNSGTTGVLYSLGSLRVDFPIGCQSILEFRATERYNDHGSMYIRYIPSGAVTGEDLDRLIDVDTEIKIKTSAGDLVFVGICTNTAISCEADYTEVHVQARSFSTITDIVLKRRTFQNTKKTLLEMAKTVMSDHEFKVDISEDVEVSKMIVQYMETDWDFLKRIAGDNGMVVMADSHSEVKRLSIGPVPFTSKEITPITTASMVPVQAAFQIQGNINPDASEFEFETTISKCGDLSVGVGYNVNQLMVIESSIRLAGEILYNHLSARKNEGVRPLLEEAVEEVMTSVALLAEVLEVEGTDIKVKFIVDESQSQDEALWVPYESAMNNFFYGMPDIGDIVFVYFESQGKVVCLGSIVKNEQLEEYPDYQKPEYKSLTNQNKMIQFTPESLNMTIQKDIFVEDAAAPTRITFGKDGNMNVYSMASNIMVVSQENIQVISSDEEVDPTPKKDKFEMESDAGTMKYTAAGGMNFWQKMAAVAKTNWNKFTYDLKESFTNGFLEIIAPKEARRVFMSVFGAEEAPEEEPIELEDYTDGVVSLWAATQVKLQVGSSSYMTLRDSDGVPVVEIHSPLYRHLGFTKSSYATESVSQTTWLDVALDVFQFALDLAGMIPVFGFVFDLANAGISLARGDYAGALMSCLAAIPGVGIAAGVGKVAIKGVKAAKAITKFTKVLDVVKTVLAVKDFGLGAFATVVGFNQLREMMESEDFEWNPDTVSFALNTFMSGFGAIASGVEAGSTMKKIHSDGVNAKKAQADAGDPNNGKKAHNGNDATQTTECGEPINMVTGSFIVEQKEFVLEDVAEPFIVQRRYESVYTNEDRLLGSKWMLNIETYISVLLNKMIICMPDGHRETFEKEDDGWKNARKGDTSYQLYRSSNTYVLKIVKEQRTFVYDLSGKILTMEDRNHNITQFEYIGEDLQKIILASGQYLKFSYHKKRLVKIEDTIGRTMTYRYKGDLLTDATYPNEGTIHYEYTSAGHIFTITDQNGLTYLKNKYDDNGRVLRQELSTGEAYILLYDDANRTNTFLATSNGQSMTFVYNRKNLVTKQIYTDNTYEEWDYDSHENIIYERNRNGAVTRRRYNEKRLLLKEERPNGLVISYTYDEKDNIIRIEDNGGRREERKYDGRSNMIQRTIRLEDAIFMDIHRKYDSRGRVISVSDGEGHETVYEYGRMLSEPTQYKTPEGNVFRYKYDEAGRNMSVESEYGITSYGYNNIALKAIIVDGEGNVTKQYYDRMCNLIQVIEPNELESEMDTGIGIRYEYEDFDRRIKTIDQLGNVIALKRNTEGSIIKEINPNAYNAETDSGEGVEHIYDVDENRIKIIYPDGGIERRKYDACGNLIKVIRPKEYNIKTDDGRGYCYAYDSENRLVQVTGPDDVVIRRFVYDLQGNVIKEINAKGYETGSTDEDRVGILYRYNYVGWMVEKREPMIFEDNIVLYKLTEYEFDKNGNVVHEKRYREYQKEKEARGRVHRIHFTYDKNNRLVKVSDTSGAVVEYRYDCLNQKIFEKRKLSDTENWIKNYKYNKAGRLVEVQESADKSGCGKSFATTKYGYDRTGNLTSIITPKGYKITKEYDAANQLICEKHFDKKSGIENRIEMTYDKAGNQIKETDVYGNEKTYCYDLMNRLVKHIAEDGGVNFVQYNRNGEIIHEVFPNEYAKNGENGNGYTYEYDVYGRRICSFNPLGQVTKKQTYNAFGELSSTTDALEDGVQYGYDFGGRNIRYETSGNSTQEYEYDPAGNIVGIVNGNRNSTSFQLDDWGRIVRITQADQSQERYTYDYAGNVISTTDGEDHVIRYTYNGINQVAVIMDQAGEKEYFQYDDEGRLSGYTDRNGNEITYAYNMYGDLVSRREQTGTYNEVYEYYANGRLKTATGDGMSYHYEYDSCGRIMTKKASGRVLLAYKYDLNGNKIAQQDLTGKVVDYHYNKLDQLIEICDNGNKLAAYEYRLDGTIKSFTNGDFMRTSYAYDKDKNITRLYMSMGSTLDRVSLDKGKNEIELEDIGNMSMLQRNVNTHEQDIMQQVVKNEYTYDHNGNRLRKKQLGGETLFQYDAKDQLTRVDYPTYSEVLFYDKVGNRTKRVSQGVEEVYEYDMRNRLTNLDIKPFTGNARRNQKSIHFEYDKQGNLLRDNQNTYTYDAFNRVKDVVTSDGMIQKNVYDAEGLRCEMEENGSLIQFLYNPQKEVVAETVKGDTIRYIRGYELIAGESHAARNYYHYACDELGSITHICEGDSLCNQYEYDAFGNVVGKEEQVENRFLFAGQQYDPVTQQYYMRARYYNPVIARFTQEDEYRGDGLNLYAYCQNNPVTYYDPSGYKRICKDAYRELKKKQAEGKSLTEAEKRAMQDYEEANIAHLYRQMSVDEARKTVAGNGELQPPVPGTDSAKWMSDSKDKALVFDNEATKGVEQVVVDFEVTKEYYDSLKKNAVPQHGSKGNPNNKYHYEGLEDNGDYTNFGIVNRDEFNANLIWAGITV